MTVRAVNAGLENLILSSFFQERFSNGTGIDAHPTIGVAEGLGIGTDLENLIFCGFFQASFSRFGCVSVVKVRSTSAGWSRSTMVIPL